MFALAVAAEAKSGLVFAFYDGQLYTKLDVQNEHNGFETIYGLVQLENAYGKSLPNVYADIGGGLVSDGFGGDFSFWRPPGQKLLLWPDSDTYGRLDLHIAPLHFIMKQFEAEQMDFRHRAHLVFWSGNSGGGDEHARDHMRECGEKHPHLFHADTIQWDNTWSAGEHILKPHAWDLRKLMRNKFNMYIRGNTWSQSFKRVAQSGGVLFVPDPNPHESFWSLLVSKCAGCYLTYDVNDMCPSVMRAIENATESELLSMAQRLWDFTRREFAGPRVLEHLLGWLNEHLKVEPFPNITRGQNDITTADGTVLVRTTCEMNKREHLLYHNNRHDQQETVGHKWQLSEWFDDSCNFRENNYLSYVAI